MIVFFISLAITVLTSPHIIDTGGVSHHTMIQ